MAQHTMTEAAILAKVSRRTIQRYAKAGKLSTTKDRQGNPLVDTTELIRVFGSIVTPTAPELSQPVVTLESLQKQLEILTKKVDEQSQEIISLSHRLASPGDQGQPTPQGSVSPRSQAKPRVKKVPIAKQRDDAQKALAEVRNRHKRTKVSMDLPIELLREEMAQRRLEIQEAEDLVASLSK
jgi:hypothetical protein